MVDHLTILLPCPFCGGEAETYQLNYGTRDHVIRCRNEKCGINPFGGKVNFGDAVRAWNQRSE